MEFSISYFCVLFFKLFSITSFKAPPIAFTISLYFIIPIVHFSLETIISSGHLVEDKS
jgi:hypothetical protein